MRWLTINMIQRLCFLIGLRERRGNPLEILSWCTEDWGYDDASCQSLLIDVKTYAPI